MDKSKWALSCEDLTVQYGSDTAIWNVSLKVPRGVFVGILGPNGAGKSTLVQSLINLVKPVSGRVLFFSFPYKSVKQKIAYVPQKDKVDWSFPITAIEVVLMGRYSKMGLFKWPRKKDKQLARESLEKVGLLSVADKPISELSGGQAQRVFLARALLQDADVYLMDEPFSGLDATSESMIMGILHSLKNEGKTLLMVHHNLESARSYFDHILLLNKRVISFGKTEDVFTKENIEMCFGSKEQLLTEMLKKSQKLQRGVF